MMKTLVHGWWYAYTVQRIATSQLNKVLTTNGAGKHTFRGAVSECNARFQASEG